MPDPNVRQTRTATGAISNPVRDLKNVRRNVTATAGELREFMGRLRGKSPREMLGIVASSSLVKSIITATVATAILIVALTVAPYGWEKMFGTEKVVAEKSSDTEPAPTPGSAEETESPEVATDPDPVTPTTPPVDPLAPLGIGEEKSAPPGTNPLDGSVDNLFDDIK